MTSNNANTENRFKELRQLYNRRIKRSDYFSPTLLAHIRGALREFRYTVDARTLCRWEQEVGIPKHRRMYFMTDFGASQAAACVDAKSRLSQGEPSRLEQNNWFVLQRLRDNQRTQRFVLVRKSDANGQQVSVGSSLGQAVLYAEKGHEFYWPGGAGLYRLVEFGPTSDHDTEIRNSSDRGSDIAKNVIRSTYEGCAQSLDAFYEMGFFARESGAFGSFPLCDDYSDEASA